MPPAAISPGTQDVPLNCKVWPFVGVAVDTGYPCNWQINALLVPARMQISPVIVGICEHNKYPPLMLAKLPVCAAVTKLPVLAESANTPVWELLT